MGSHLGAIGFEIRGDDGLAESLRRLMERSWVVGEAGDGVVVHAHDDPSGARVTVVTEHGAITCLTPTFRPGSSHFARLGTLADDDCRYERPLLLEVLESADLPDPVYPLAMQVDDLALSEGRIRALSDGGATVQVELVGLAESLQIFADEAAYRASGTPMAAQSLIPSGLFVPPGHPEEATFRPSARALISGVVLDADLRTHAILGGRFVRMTVDSYGGAYALLAEASDLEDPSGSVVVPAPGSIVSGTFWLSGRVLEAAR